MVYIFISVGVLHEAFDNEVNIVEADFVEYHQHCLYHLLYGREMSIWYFEEHISHFQFFVMCTSAHFQNNESFYFESTILFKFKNSLKFLKLAILVPEPNPFTLFVHLN
jgi:hypothetical protein